MEPPRWYRPDEPLLSYRVQASQVENLSGSDLRHARRVM